MPETTLRPSFAACRFLPCNSHATAATAMVVAAAIVSALSLARPAAAQLNAGDVIVQNGDMLQRYSASGTLLTTYKTTGTGNFEGDSITPSGNIVTTYRGSGPNKGGVLIYSPSGGTALKKFSATSVEFPGDVNVFADGTLAINDQYGSIVEYSQSGTFIRTITVTTNTNTDLFGGAIAPDNTLYVTDSGLNTVYHYSETGTLLNSFSTSFGPGDIVVDPADGTLFITDSPTGDIVHTTADGTVLNSFSSGVPLDSSGDFDGIAISGDGSTLYAASYKSTTIQEFNATTDAFLKSFSITSPGGIGFLTVVPSVSPASAPEPGSVALVGCGGLAMVGGMVRRRRNS